MIATLLCRRRTPAPCLLGCLFALALPATGHAADLTASWDGGLRLASEDGRTKLKLGGRLQQDWALFSDSSLPPALAAANGTEFRRARFYMSGTVYGRFVYKAQFDFAGGDADLKDAYMGLTGLPGVGTVLVGHMKEPFSLEELTSSKYIPFLERGVPNALAPSRNAGAMATNDFFDERVHAAAGVFRDVNGYGTGTGAGEWTATGRLTGQPYRNGTNRIHLGGAASYRHTDRFAAGAGPEAHLAPDYVDTGGVAVDGVVLLGGEAAVVAGPAHAAGEYIAAMLGDANGGGDAWVGGWTAQAGVFLTGESRPYKDANGTFGGVDPDAAAFTEGWGAWELAARVSDLDLNAGPAVRGGRLRTVAGAVNWYVNDVIRVALNYVQADVAGSGVAHVTGGRFQVAF